MLEKILMVDDESAILQGYQRLLHHEFQTEIATGGAEGLAAIASRGPYAVVVSDMRMPVMDGVQFLTQVKSLCPDVIRIMLTGNSEIETAVHAVNEGNIFRFLTKPCNKETLAKTLTAALMQYRLVTAEKELLQNTLSGSITVLTEVLSLVNPAAFSRAVRVRRYIRHVAISLALPSPWRFEVAGMMSQLGCVTLDPETIEAVYAGQKLSPDEQARFDAHPTIASDLLAKIPRMEPVAWMIAHQNRAAPVEGDIADREMADMRLGAEILRATLAFDELLCKDMSKTEAANRLLRQNRDLDPRIFQALVELEPEIEDREVRTCAIDDLATGMILHQDVRTHTGVLMVAKGQEVTFPLVLKLKNAYRKGAIGDGVSVFVLKGKAARTS